MAVSLFDSAEKENRAKAQPLAVRMRPRTLEEFVGQRHFLGEGKLLRRLLAADRLGSVVFHGPPGTGK
ncbi:MAG TPA: AAA family ATPase, partial [Planctomycetaceae bacterium]|nr:AAA family ATPase [Planctomycetaceae bacterium]